MTLRVISILSIMCSFYVVNGVIISILRLRMLCFDVLNYVGFPNLPIVTVKFPLLVISEFFLLQLQLLYSSKTTSQLTTILLVRGPYNQYAFDPCSVPRCTSIRDLSSSLFNCVPSIFAYLTLPKTRRLILGLLS